MTLFVRRQSIFANNYHRAEQAALLPREDVEQLSDHKRKLENRCVISLTFMKEISQKAVGLLPKETEQCSQVGPFFEKAKKRKT